MRELPRESVVERDAQGEIVRVVTRTIPPPPPAAAPAGSAWFCELKPYIKGECYHVASSARVLGWRAENGKTLPITAHGLVNYKAFLPNPRDPASGMAWIELRGPGNEKRWWSPLFDREISDKKLKEVMVELAKSPPRPT